MKLLLDTHAFLWWDSDQKKLSSRAPAAFLDAGNSLHLSHASVWELQIKSQLGKLKLRLPLAQLLRDQMTRNGVQLEPISVLHILTLEQLPHIHRDPFDRMLVAQALHDGFHLVTGDQFVSSYGVAVVW